LAQAELDRLSRMGVRTAKVVQENEPPSQETLVLLSVSQEMQAALLTLQPLLQAHALQPCE
jgi:hypothetical protein